MIRLQKFLADAGVASRRASESIIASGRVRVNGMTVESLGFKVDPSTDAVELNGVRIYARDTMKIYIMLHKPEGYVTTSNDPEHRPIIFDLLPRSFPRLFAVGRLDYDSSGLIILTNDGHFAERLTHPKNGVSKVYIVKMKGAPSPGSLKKFSNGILIEGVKTAPCKIKILRSEADGSYSVARVSLSEGRNRQIRKMCDAIGHPSVSLKRVSIGSLRLGNLKRGSYRNLTENEIDGLKRG